MSQSLMDMKQLRHAALSKAESLLQAAERAGRQMTEQESKDFDVAMAAVKGLEPQIARIEKQNTIFKQFPGGVVLTDKPRHGSAQEPKGVMLSEEYFSDFHSYIRSGGMQIGAALYEGSNSAGGYAVPVTVDGQIVPLAPAEMGVRSVANVIVTASDIKIPRGTAFGTAAAKAESGGSTHSFTESDPTIDQFTLSAFMSGLTHTVSFEIVQDISTFQSFCLNDLVTAIQQYEEAKFVSGSGSGEPQGLIGNTGAGVTDVAEGSDSYASELLNATFDVLGTLNAAYHPGAGWLMSRATGVAIRKAQMKSNLFVPVWTREGGKDYLHGYPVTFSSSMPAIAASATPVLFGDFKSGYVIGDRGSSGVYIKVLDQPLATAGQVILLGYRRTDARVRRSEAIQAITLASS